MNIDVLEAVIRGHVKGDAQVFFEKHIACSIPNVYRKINLVCKKQKKRCSFWKVSCRITGFFCGVICGNALWKNYAIWKWCSNYVKFGTKSTHFENVFSKCVNFWINLTHFEKKCSMCGKSVHQHYHWCKLLTHFEKKN